MIYCDGILKGWQSKLCHPFQHGFTSLCFLATIVEEEEEKRD